MVLEVALGTLFESAGPRKGQNLEIVLPYFYRQPSLHVDEAKKAEIEDFLADDWFFGPPADW